MDAIKMKTKGNLTGRLLLLLSISFMLVLGAFLPQTAYVHATESDPETSIADDYYYEEAVGNYHIYFYDEARLISSSERDEVIDAMRNAAVKGDMIFYTTNDRLSSDENSHLRQIVNHFSSTSRNATVFGIFMGNRKLYIFDTKSMQRIISDQAATSICDRIYKYASNADYARCARNAFELLQAKQEGGFIAEPMRILTLLMISLAMGLAVTFVVAVISRSKINGSKEECEEDNNSDTLGVNLIESRVTRHYFYTESDSSSSGGGSGGGGGGSSGGGGGGGGHSF